MCLIPCGGEYRRDRDDRFLGFGIVKANSVFHAPYSNYLPHLDLAYVRRHNILRHPQFPQTYPGLSTAVWRVRDPAHRRSKSRRSRNTSLATPQSMVFPSYRIEMTGPPIAPLRLPAVTLSDTTDSLPTFAVVNVNDFNVVACSSTPRPNDRGDNFHRSPCCR